MRSTGLVLGISFILSLAPGCATDSAGGGPDKIRDDIPDPGPGGVQLVSPTFTVAATTESFTCMRIPFSVTEDMYVNASTAWQVAGGHHTMLYFSDEVQEGGDDPHECGGGDMGNIRFIGVGTGDGVGIALPGGVAMKIPAGVKIYTQSHYLNTTENEILAQDVINLDLIPAAEVEQIAGAFTEVDLTLELPAGQTTTRTIDCTAPMEMDVPWMIPHMHELGSHYTIELVRGEQTTTLYDEAWDPSFRDHFPLVQYDQAIHLTPTDHLRTTCTWNNNTLEKRLFPNEMCATFMPFYPSPDGALLACDEFGSQFKP